jgi:hypothetical protein
VSDIIRSVRIALWLTVALGFGAFELFAQSNTCAATPTNYLLSTSPDHINDILQDYGLVRVYLPPSEDLPTGIFLVSQSSSSPLPAVIAADSHVYGFEPDICVTTPVTDPTVFKPSAAAVAAVNSALILAYSTPSSNYFGSNVSDAYVNQPTAVLADLTSALTRWGSLISGNSPIVAVIDTGVDPCEIALQNVLVGNVANGCTQYNGGFDFIQNAAGGSELDDLTAAQVAALETPATGIAGQSSISTAGQSSVAVLDQSTVAILEQSTVAILEGGGLSQLQFFGHGTAVAGLIHLVAPAAQIMPLKAFKGDGTSKLSDIIRAIDYAVDNNAAIINMSFAASAPSPALAAAIAYANEHGVVCIAAAGNDGMAETEYPAAFNGVIGVGSTDPADGRSAFSNFGSPTAQTAAPGEGLIALLPGNNYGGVWGTSFSTALVSGAAALMTQQFPNASASAIRHALDHGHPINPQLGLGKARLDLMASMLYLTMNGLFGFLGD